MFREEFSEKREERENKMRKSSIILRCHPPGEGVEEVKGGVSRGGYWRSCHHHGRQVHFFFFFFFFFCSLQNSLG